MKNSKNFRFLIAILAVFFVFGTVDSFAQKRKPTVRRKTTVRKTIVKKPVIKLYTVQSGERFR
nr:hypothetical protein [Tatlockia sp.]